MPLVLALSTSRLRRTRLPGVMGHLANERMNRGVGVREHPFFLAVSFGLPGLPVKGLKNRGIGAFRFIRRRILVASLNEHVFRSFWIIFPRFCDLRA